MLTPLFGFLLIAAAWSVYWYISLGHVQQAVAQLKQQDPGLQCDSEDWGGYPFRISFDCTGATIPAKPSKIEASKLRLIIQAWNPGHVLGAVFGPVKYDGATSNGEAIRFSYRRTDDELALASLLAEKQTLTLHNGKTLQIAKVNAHVRPAKTGTQFEVLAQVEGVSIDELVLDSFKIDGKVDPAKTQNEQLDILSEPSEYLDAIWIAQRLFGLNDDEMNAAQAVISPLLKANNNKLPVRLQDGTLYWGPFALKN